MISVHNYTLAILKSRGFIQDWIINMVDHVLIIVNPRAHSQENYRSRFACVCRSVRLSSVR